jgi:4-amino-4-deoxy-L-arabinose transferase-like glycosyltransferase
VNTATYTRGETTRDLLGLLLLALGYRLVFLLLLNPVLDSPDSVLYLETAEHLAQEDFFGYDPKIPLLYPLLTAAAHLCIADLEWAGRMVSFLCGLLTLIPLYLLVRSMHGRRAAQLTGVTVAVWPWLADYACRVSTEATACLFWVGGVALLAQGLRRGGWRIPAAALCFFALTLTRPEGLFVLLTALPAGLWLAWGDRTQLRRLVPFAGVAAVLVVANTLYTRQLTGEEALSYRAGFLWGEFDWARFAQTFVTATTDLVPIMLGPVLLLFLGAGVFLPRPHRDLRLEAFALLFFLPQWAAAIAVLSPSPRYFMAPILLLAAWSAAGMALVMARVPAGRWAPVLRALPLLAVVASMGLGTVVTLGSEYTGRIPRQPREYKAAGLWLREYASPGLIFTRKPQLAYYAGMPSTGPAEDDTLDAALARAQAAQARYLAVDERYAPAGLRPLLDPTQAPPPLRWLHTVAPYPGGRVVLYALGE